jgi:hypothetical protein
MFKHLHVPLPLKELDHMPPDYVRHIDSDGAVEALEGGENAHRQHRRIAGAQGLRLVYGQELPRQRIAAFAPPQPMTAQPLLPFKSLFCLLVFVW